MICNNDKGPVLTGDRTTSTVDTTLLYSPDQGASCRV